MTYLLFSEHHFKIVWALATSSIRVLQVWAMGLGEVCAGSNHFIPRVNSKKKRDLTYFARTKETVFKYYKGICKKLHKPPSCTWLSLTDLHFFHLQCIPDSWSST